VSAQDQQARPNGSAPGPGVEVEVEVEQPRSREEEFFHRLAMIADSGASAAPLEVLAEAVARLAIAFPRATPPPDREAPGAVTHDGGVEVQAAEPVSANGNAAGEAEPADLAPSPARRAELEALLEHLGHAAAQARRGTEAQALIGAMVPVAARLVTMPSALLPAVPAIVGAASAVARALGSSANTRPFLRVVPAIVVRTLEETAGQGTVDRATGPADPVDVLAEETRKVLSSPESCVRIYRRSCAADRRFHSTVW
jgi:hypothetical protein